MNHVTSHDFSVSTFQACDLCHDRDAKYLRYWWLIPGQEPAIAKLHYCGVCKRQQRHAIAHPTLCCSHCGHLTSGIAEVVQGYCDSCKRAFSQEVKTVIQ